jgi:DNA invertase Pin-like site-specific DNA recombinase
MKPLVRRCALYTRKSSEEGLEQDFNSLDAQREACAAYVKSQASEGWRALDARYDDGGFSGGSMERPALQRLLADIAAGKVDVVVVYKIDRLTRALMDFARMVELFDRHNVSFVSVTQAFNTTSSMGRLTLNVLLSFAQFEREVTGERIRDKIAASKTKGMWMGGNLPLGYDLPQPGRRALVLNEAEAGTVRMIFAKYLELGSVRALEHWLAVQGIRSKRRTTANGRSIGGQPVTRGAIFHMLRNRTYLGMIVHRDKVHAGMHPAIVDADIFQAVHRQLDANARRLATPKAPGERAALTGRIFDADGRPMTPTFAYGQQKKLYRYYASASTRPGERRGERGDAIRRIPAPALEARLAGIVRRLVPSASPDPLAVLTRVEVYPESGAPADAGGSARRHAEPPHGGRSPGAGPGEPLAAASVVALAHAVLRRPDPDRRRRRTRPAVGPGAGEGAARGPRHARAGCLRRAGPRDCPGLDLPSPPRAPGVPRARPAARDPRRPAVPGSHPRPAPEHAHAIAVERAGPPDRLSGRLNQRPASRIHRPRYAQ